MTNIIRPFFIQSYEQDICSGFFYWFKQTPDAIALNVEGKSYSYKELYNVSYSIYTELKKYNTTEVGVYCSNSLYSYAAIIAVSMSGACYVPLNAKFPEKKIEDIINDCKLELVISETPLQLNLAKNFANISPLISFEDGGIEIAPFVSQPLAYILYTSGSTGLPKGVPVKKNSVNSFFNFFIKEYDFVPSDKFLQAYELSFDVSVFSMFCAWNAGASVYAVNEGANKFFEIFKTIQEHKITVCSMVPSVLSVMSKYFKDFNFTFVRYSFFSGDALYQSLAKQWKRCIPNAELHNFYGPTETTIVCTKYKWEEQQSQKESLNDIVPIGVPFPEMHFVLLGESGKVFSYSGEAGELCFSGTQVIDEYINKQSAESFFYHEDQRYYKTGDWVSVNSEGNLIFHGRRDSQVKIKGYRIELAELENAIKTAVFRNCKVIAEKTGSEFVLNAFIEGEVMDREEVISKLRNIVPDYMLPAKIWFTPYFPLTINNKIDIERLKLISNAS